MVLLCLENSHEAISFNKLGSDMVHLTKTVSDKPTSALEAESINDNNKTILKNDQVNRADPFLGSRLVDSVYPSVETYGENVFVIWTVSSIRSYPTPVQYPLFFTRSTDNGTTFSKPIKLSNDTQPLNLPVVTASKNSIYIIYTANSDNNTSIFIIKSSDNGTTFSKPINLNINITNETRVAAFALENNFYLVWADYAMGNYNLFFTKSTDNGTTFSKPIKFSNNPGEWRFFNIFVPLENNFYLVWADYAMGNYNLFFTKSTDNGTTFSKPIKFSNSTTVFDAPDISVSRSSIYAVWLLPYHYFLTGFEPDRIQFYKVGLTKSSDNGTTFSKPIILGHGNNYTTDTLSTVGNNVYLAWNVNSTSNLETGNFDILFTKSTDNGTTFSKPINLSNNTGLSISPFISVPHDGNDNLYLVWQDNYNGNFDILFTKSTDNGTTFSKPINLSNRTTAYLGR